MAEHPFEVDIDLWNRYIGELRTGASRSEAARSVGFHPRAVANWLKGRPLEEEEARDAISEATDRIVSKLYEAAQAGEPWAVNLWLKKMGDPEIWRESGNRIGVAGNINVLVAPSELERMLGALGIGPEGPIAGGKELNPGVSSVIPSLE